MDYRKYIIKTYVSVGEQSSSDIRFAPLSGQGISTSLRVEYDKSIRPKYDIGTLFKIRAKVIYRQGTPILYSHYNQPYEIVSEEEAHKFIKDNFTEDI